MKADIHEVLRASLPAYRFYLTHREKSILRRISDCSPVELCGNRACPTCSSDREADWWSLLEAKLPKKARWFLVTFVLPEVLTKLALSNRGLIGNAMFVAGPEALRDLVKDEIGATPAIVAVYSTASSNLWGHVHIHLVVTAGGLTRDRGWLAYPRRRFVDPEAAGRRFRASLREEVLEAHGGHALSLWGEALRPLRESPDALPDLLRDIPLSDWTPDMRPIADGELWRVLKYLAGHFSPFLNGRSYQLVGDEVSFEARPDQSGGGETVRLSMQEFVRRALLHLHPEGFFAVRRFGFIAGPKARQNLDTVRTLLRRKEEPMTFFELILRRPSIGCRERHPDVGRAVRLRRGGIKSRSPPRSGAEPPRPRVQPVGRGCP
jgi:hypothetical protein